MQIVVVNLVHFRYARHAPTPAPAPSRSRPGRPGHPQYRRRTTQERDCQIVTRTYAGLPRNRGPSYRPLTLYHPRGPGRLFISVGREPMPDQSGPLATLPVAVLRNDIAACGAPAACMSCTLVPGLVSPINTSNPDICVGRGCGAPAAHHGPAVRGLCSVAPSARSTDAKSARARTKPRIWAVTLTQRVGNRACGRSELHCAAGQRVNQRLPSTGIGQCTRFDRLINARSPDAGGSHPGSGSIQRRRSGTTVAFAVGSARPACRRLPAA
jgi:hypothetical protein